MSLDAEWESWVHSNLDRNCDPTEIVKVLMNNGYCAHWIEMRMGERFPYENFRNIPWFTTTGQYSEIANRPFTKTGFRDPDNGVAVTKFDTDLLQLYVWDHFLTKEQTEQVIEMTDQKLRPSTVAGDTSDTEFRTSSTCDLPGVDNEFCRSLDEKISRKLGLDPTYSEALQAQKYLKGQQFKMHNDWFMPGTETYVDHCSQLGQRTWSCMIYLNDNFSGGETEFKFANHKFTPKAGRAVIWNNLFASGMPNYKCLHAGLPVEEGEKYIITKWFRLRGDGPLPYVNENAAAAIH